MKDVFRVLDRLNVTGRGTVYLIKNYACSNICIGDILYDLQSNRFKVKGIEMPRRIPDASDYVITSRNRLTVRVIVPETLSSM